MNIVSIEFSACSPSIESLDEVRRVFCPNAEILREEDMLKVRIMRLETTDYHSDSVLSALIKMIQNIRIQSLFGADARIGFVLDIGVVVSNADEFSIPGITFPIEYIRLSSEFEIPARFHLEISSSTKRGSLTSGAYLYIGYERETDIVTLNKIAGIHPSVVYRKGCLGRETVVDFNSWGVEVSTEGELPDVPAYDLMHKLKKPKEIGLFCKENNLDSHVDITCYSVYSDTICFQLDPSFFTFLTDLSIQYLDIDFMN